MQAVVFRLGSKRLAVGLDRVRAVVPLRPLSLVPRAPACLLGMMNHRGRVVCVVEVAGLVGFAARVPHGQVVLLDLPRMDLGLQVDEVTDIVEVEWAPGGEAGALVRPATDPLGPLGFLDAEVVAEAVRAACQPPGPARPRTV